MDRQERQRPAEAPMAANDAAGGDQPIQTRILDAVRQSVIATDAGGKIIFWNHFAEELYGWRADEVLGSNILDVVPADRPSSEPVMESIVAGQTFVGEYLVKRKTGETFPAFVTTSSLADDKGAVLGAVGVSYDMTDQKARDQRYETVFKSMKEGFALCEAIRGENGELTDYRIVEVNPALQAMLGKGPELIGQRLSATDYRSPAWLALCDKVLGTGDPASFEFRAVTGRWYGIRVNRMTADVIAQFFFDITERKEAEARQAEMVDELNHRVRNNLAMVSSILTMQARAVEPGYREHLLKAVDRVHSISEVHGALYRGHSAKDVDFARYLESLCRGLSDSLLADDRIRIEVEAEAMTLSLDQAVLLGMIVNELVTNAVKHAYPGAAGGVISVRFTRAGKGALLAIGDSGCGLPGDFETGSSGLGMKLVRSMVKQAGATLTVRRHPGATFEIRIPPGQTPGSRVGATDI
jgi:PAS domain S-box-containing protein